MTNPSIPGVDAGLWAMPFRPALPMNRARILGLGLTVGIAIAGCGPRHTYREIPCPKLERLDFIAFNGIVEHSRKRYFYEFWQPEWVTVKVEHVQSCSRSERTGA